MVELLGLLGAEGLTLAGIVAIMVLGLYFGFVYPASVLKRAWADLDHERAKNEKEQKELQATLSAQASLIEKLNDQVGDMKAVSQATLYAMQEIQAAGRYAAGMDALPRSPLQKSQDQES